MSASDRADLLCGCRTGSGSYAHVALMVLLGKEICKVCSPISISVLAMAAVPSWCAARILGPSGRVLWRRRGRMLLATLGMVMVSVVLMVGCFWTRSALLGLLGLVISFGLWTAI
ncbi:hypothetical protein RchiOBHm_Chr1g0324961 [Rosa chinensis]|uniref:Uncharacterized protein n=1 Tax=Rosa chinensis TaxID=74649 RepID=A0A2P6S9Z0_ROSCH|nr:hypothetical protein RchiOBHm_Chr1g0324961 [Rosa chinensis]